MVSADGGALTRKSTERRSEDYVLFDLGKESALEPITTAENRFRVTCYPPQAMYGTHGPGKHCYLMAREAMDATVVINMPKLKTHRKAGLTGALKNCVGLNGHKQYLPHHRKGSVEEGGDCYLERSVLGAMREFFLDGMNSEGNMMWRRFLRACNEFMTRACGRLLPPHGTEGSWYGNDTVWRMCLDLNRILVYGTSEGKLADRPQRRIIHITDGMVAGQGEGPLAPVPAPLGVLSLSLSAPVADWVHSILMGFAPHRIPLIRESFNPLWRLTSCAPQAIRCYVDGASIGVSGLFDRCGMSFIPPGGWKNHCEAIYA